VESFTPRRWTTFPPNPCSHAACTLGRFVTRQSRAVAYVPDYQARSCGGLGESNKALFGTRRGKSAVEFPPCDKDEVVPREGTMGRHTLVVFLGIPLFYYR
jgi:hypothetical protein